MSGLNSGLNACVSGLNGISARVNANSQNLASAGAYASKTRAAFLSVVNTGSSLNSFIPEGVTATNQHFVTEVGSPVQSDVGTFMSLSGQGFFVVNNNADDANPDSPAYTRVGTFSEDKNGNFANHVGQFLKVFYVSSDGTPISTNTASIDALQTASTAGLSGSPVATTQASIKGVLSAEAALTTSKQMTMGIYDTLGVQHVVTLNYEKTQLNPAQWTVTASCPDGTLTTADYGTTPMVIGFDANGNPASYNGVTTGAIPDLDFTWANGASPSVMTMDFGGIGQSTGLRSVGNDSNYDLPPPVIDGRGAGKYQETTIDSDGFMWATFDNGSTIRYARIPLATFPDANKLAEQTGGSFAATGDSGGYTLNFTNQGTAGGIMSGSLEESTIDTASVFTDLIVDQQRYTADLKGISTIDDMLTALEHALA